MEDNGIMEEIDEIFYEEFDPENVVFEDPEKQTSKGEKPTDYVVAKIAYRYPSGNGFVKKPLKVIGCEMSSDSGVQVRDGNYGNEYSILSRIPHTTEEGKGFVNFTKMLDLEACKHYKNFAKACKMDKDFDPERPGKTVTKILYVKDGDESYPPSTYLKFFFYPKSGYKTKIYAPSEEVGGDPIEIAWDSARNCKMKFIPCIHYHRCNNAGAGGFKIQNLCVSVVVTEIVPNANVISQRRTLAGFDTTRAQQIAAQVASLKSLEQKKSLPLDSETHHDSDESSTFSGLDGEEKEQDSEAQMESIKPEVVKVPGINSSKNSSIKNLVSSVKPRN